MKYGPIVAERYRKQYCKRGKWNVYSDWDIQPEQNYLILRELKSKEAISALLNSSWVKRLPNPRPTRLTKER